MATRWQVKMIHTLKSKLGISEGDYRVVLEKYGVKSSKALSYGKANHLIDRLAEEGEKMGVWKRKYPNRRRRQKYNDLAGREDMATPAQLRMVEAAWADVSRMRNAEARQRALLKFCKRITKKAKMEWLNHRDIEKLMAAINAMKESKEKGKKQ